MWVDAQTIFLLILILTLRYGHCANIIRLPNINEGTFSLRYVDKKHSQTAFKTVTARDLYDCADQCLYHTNCKSINYKDLGTNENICELVAYDRNDYDTYNTAIGFKHYDTGWNRITQFKNLYYPSSCIVPSSKHCDVVYDTKLSVSASTYDCDKLWSYFEFVEGSLHHHCSGLQVCVKSDYLYLSKTCPAPDPDAYWKIFRREFNDWLLYSSGCIYRYSSNFRYSSTCSRTTSNSYKFQFPQLAKGNVRTTLFFGSSTSSNFNTVLSYSNYPNSYSESGYSDDMSYADYYYYPMIMRKQAYFEAPTTGYYEFSLACRDNCQLYIGSSDSSKTLIVDRTTYGEYENCCDYHSSHSSQFAAGRYLTKGTKYYLEVILVTRTSSMNLETAYKIPGTNSWQKIHSRYLHKV